MALKVNLFSLYEGLNPVLFNDLQNYLNDITGYNRSIFTLIDDFCKKTKRDNVLLTHVLNLKNTRSIGDMIELYELLELMEYSL